MPDQKTAETREFGRALNVVSPTFDVTGSSIDQRKCRHVALTVHTVSLPVRPPGRGRAPLPYVDGAGYCAGGVFLWRFGLGFGFSEAAGSGAASSFVKSAMARSGETNTSSPFAFLPMEYR